MECPSTETFLTRAYREGFSCWWLTGENCIDSVRVWWIYQNPPDREPQHGIPLSERRDGFLPVRSIEILAVQKNNILSVIVSGFTSMYAMRMG